MHLKDENGVGGRGQNKYFPSDRAPYETSILHSISFNPPNNTTVFILLSPFYG